MWRFFTFLLVLAAIWPRPAFAEGLRGLTHYSHQRWIEGSEAPVPVVAIAQGQDGFLWLATGDGLFRFDGVGFERIDSTDDGRAHELPSALLATKSGDVWTNFETSRRFAIYREGGLHFPNAPAAPSRIVEMLEGADGAIWARTANFNAELLRFYNGHWRTFGTADGLPQNNATSMVMAQDGTLWIACRSAVARLLPGAERFEIFLETPDTLISQDLDGRIWLSEERGSYPITGPKGRGAPPSLPAPYRTKGTQTRAAPLFDRQGNIWVATRYYGVRRLGTSGAALGQAPAEMESFTSRDGLSSDVTHEIFEDREGNIWVGTENGIDKFRPATLISEPVLRSPAAYGDKLLEGSDGSVYIGQSRTIYRVRPGGIPEPLLENVVEPQSLCEAPDGALWIGLPTQILVWAQGSVRQRIERPDQKATHNIIYDCAFDTQGAYWISAAQGGVHRYANGRWELKLASGDQADTYPTTMVRAPEGGVVVQSGAQLIWLDGKHRKSAPLEFGDSSPKVLTLYGAGDVIYAAGAFGLSQFRGQSITTAHADKVSQLSRINGVVQTPQGDTWLAYPKSVVRLSSRELERALSEGTIPAHSLSLGRGDGLVSRPHSHSQRAMVRGGDGRLWIATETGTLWMDPARLVRNAWPPNLVITSVDSDGKVYRDPTALDMPAATSKIAIDFAVLSFSDPGRVQLRYKLEGFDKDWVDPGSRRQAFYTHLPPGAYRFRVIAANSDGIWNREGAAVNFDLPPTFTQSKWFVLLCTALGLFLLWLLYRLRVVQIASRIRTRLEERIKERERIARELHDTLLQGVQGLILRFQAVSERIPVEDASRGQLEAALATADEVVIDARNRVHDLRGHEGTGDISTVIEKLVAATPFDPPIPVRIVVEGKSRQVDPLVAAEITRIVREALINVAHHAQAPSAEIAIGFEPRHLAIRVRDYGIGIPEQVLARGHKDDHFGMIGMRERAERIGGKISINSSPKDGSEITLLVPAELAFAAHKSKRRAWLWRALGRGYHHD